MLFQVCLYAVSLDTLYNHELATHRNTAKSIPIKSREYHILSSPNCNYLARVGGGGERVGPMPLRAKNTHSLLGLSLSLLKNNSPGKNVMEKVGRVREAYLSVTLAEWPP